MKFQAAFLDSSRVRQFVCILLNSFRETAFKPRMKHVGKVFMYMDSARDSKLLSFENDEILQIWVFLVQEKHV